MLVEFQLTAVRLREILLRRIRGTSVCVTEEYETKAGLLVLDHLEFPDAGVFSRESASITIHVPGAADQYIDGTLVRYAQPVILHLVSTSTLVANGAAASADTLYPEITIFLDLTMTVASGVANLRVQISDVDASSIEAFEPGIGAKIKKQVQFDVTLPMDFSSLEDLLGVPVTATNAGIVIDSELSRVAMRVEVNGASRSVAAWVSFFTDSLPNQLGTHDWSILIDQAMIVPVVVNRVGSAMAGSASFSLESGPSGLWDWRRRGPRRGGRRPQRHETSGSARIIISFSGEAVDACSCFFSNIDIDVDVIVSVSLSVPTANTLRMDAYISWDLNDAEVFCCALTNALFWPIVGAVLLGSGEVEFWEYLAGAVLVPITPFIATIVEASDRSPDIRESPECVKISDTHIQCDQTVSISAGFGSLTLEAVSGLPNGPLLSGSMNTGTELATAQIETSTRPFSWHIEGSCSQSFSIVNTASVYVTEVGNAPISICEVTILNDPLNIYNASTVFADVLRHWLPAEIIIIPTLTPEFLANPYPCTVKIKTNGGARIIQFDAPAELAKAERKYLTRLIKLQRASCERAINSLFKLLGSQIAIRLTLPDPSPEIIVDHFWQVMVQGLTEQDTIVARDDLGQVIAKATAGVRGAVQLSTPLATATEKEATLILSRTTGTVPHMLSATLRRRGMLESAVRVDRNDDGKKRRIDVKEIVLIRDSVFPLPNPARSVIAGQLHGVPVVAVVTDAGLAVYDVSTLGRPFLAQILQSSGLCGAILWQDQVVLWNKQGIGLLAIGESRVGFPFVHRMSLIDDVFLTANYLAVLSCEEVCLFDYWLDQAFRIRAQGASYLAGTGRNLVIGSTQTIEVVDVACAAPPQRRSNHVISGLSVRSAPAMAGARDTLFLPNSSGGGSVVEVTDHGLVELTRYYSDPWFVSGARVGDIIARLTDHGHTLVISHITRASEPPLSEASTNTKA